MNDIIELNIKLKVDSKKLIRDIDSAIFILSENISEPHHFLILSEVLNNFKTNILKNK